MKPGWQCRHPGGSRAPQPALVSGAPGRAGLCLHLRAGEGVCLHPVPSLWRALSQETEAGRRTGLQKLVVGGVHAHPGLSEGLGRLCRVLSPCAWPPLPMLSKGWHQAC